MSALLESRQPRSLATPAPSSGMMDLAELQSRLRDGPMTSAQIVDVRTPIEFRMGQIAGSQNRPAHTLKSAVVEELKTDAVRKPLVLVCGTSIRSKAAAARLARAGVTESFVLTGGLNAWKEAGLPVVQTGHGWALERQVRVAAGALVFMGCLLGYAVTPVFYILPAFIGAGLVFAGVTNTCGMAMLMARMPWNQ